VLISRIKIPRAIHHQIHIQHEPGQQCDEQILSVHIDHDDLDPLEAHNQHTEDITLDTLNSFADEHLAQPHNEPVDRITFKHDEHCNTRALILQTSPSMDKIRTSITYTPNLGTRLIVTALVGVEVEVLLIEFAGVSRGFS